MAQISEAKTISSARAARDGEQFELPQVVGRWRLERLIGAGELTCVYRARPADCPADRPAAHVVKMLRPGRQDDSRAVSMLRSEAYVGLSVSHPHLISVLAAHVHEPPYYVVMPELAGSTLAAHLVHRRRLAAPVALWVARQVAEALGALHERGWMHADVKPGNVQLSPEGHATLLDLGFASQIDELHSVAERPILGTIHYLAPEMVTSTLRSRATSDVYSLGATLFEMLSGRPPFDGRDRAELAAKHRQAPAPDLANLVPDLPKPLVELVRRMLAKHPLRRPQSAEELVDQFTRLEIETFADRHEPRFQR